MLKVFKRPDGQRHLVAELAKVIAVEPDAPTFDTRQHGDQGQLDLAVDPGQAQRFHRLFLAMGQGQRGPGFAAQVAAGLLDRNLTSRPRAATAAQPGRARGHLPCPIRGCEVRQFIGRAPGVEQIRSQHRVAGQAAKSNTAHTQKDIEHLGVVHVLEQCRGRQQRGERRQCLGGRKHGRTA
jgi:hypothetical protein